MRRAGFRLHLHNNYSQIIQVFLSLSEIEDCLLEALNDLAGPPMTIRFDYFEHPVPTEKLVRRRMGFKDTIRGQQNNIARLQLFGLAH